MIRPDRRDVSATVDCGVSQKIFGSQKIRMVRVNMRVGGWDLESLKVVDAG